MEAAPPDSIEAARELSDDLRFTKDGDDFSWNSSIFVYYIDSVINLELSDRVVRGAGGGGDGFVGQLVLGVGGQSQSRNCQVRV